MMCVGVRVVTFGTSMMRLAGRTLCPLTQFTVSNVTNNLYTSRAVV